MKIKAIISLILAAALALTGVCAFAQQDGQHPVMNYYGVYTDPQDGFDRLRILPADALPNVTIQLTLFRTADLEFTAVYGEDGALTGQVADENGASALTVIVAPKDTGFTVTFTQSAWEIIPAGTACEFVPGAPEVSMDIFAALFEGSLTGHQGTAGASLKDAAGAAALLETVVYADAAFWPEGRLAAVLAEAVSAMDAARREELLSSMTGTVVPLIDAAFEDMDSVRGRLEDAGAYETVAGLIADPFAYTSWTAFKAAFPAA